MDKRCAIGLAGRETRTGAPRRRGAADRLLPLAIVCRYMHLIREIHAGGRMSARTLECDLPANHMTVRPPQQSCRIQPQAPPLASSNQPSPTAPASIYLAIHQPDSELGRVSPAARGIPATSPDPTARALARP